MNTGLNYVDTKSPDFMDPNGLVQPSSCLASNKKRSFLLRSSKARDSDVEQYRTYLDEKFKWKGLHYEQFFRPQTNKPWFNKHFFKKKIILINRLRANHYNLNYSLHRKNIVASKACPCGDPTQDINHIIFSCPLISPKADKFITYVANSYIL